MNGYKTDILKKICYTELVYERINKKLDTQYSTLEIENMIIETLEETHESQFKRKGKNIYVTNAERTIRLTINSNTFRIITVDRIKQ